MNPWLLIKTINFAASWDAGMCRKSSDHRQLTPCIGGLSNNFRVDHTFLKNDIFGLNLVGNNA